MTIDYKKLWEDFKAELERDRDSFYVDRIHGGTGTVKTHGDEFKANEAERILDRMNQAETFARVRDEMRVK